MGMMLRLVSFVCLGSTLVLAGTWLGALVDINCYASAERNVNPHDSLGNVDRDRGGEILFCSPNAKTKRFGIVDRDGQSFKLDVGGNTKAAELTKKVGKKPYYIVEVTGEMNKDTVKVDLISIRYGPKVIP